MGKSIVSFGLEIISRKNRGVGMPGGKIHVNAVHVQAMEAGEMPTCSDSARMRAVQLAGRGCLEFTVTRFINPPHRCHPPASSPFKRSSGRDIGAVARAASAIGQSLCGPGFNASKGFAGLAAPRYLSCLLALECAAKWQP